MHKFPLQRLSVLVGIIAGVWQIIAAEPAPAHAPKRLPESPGPDLLHPDWGSYEVATNGTALVTIKVKDWPTARGQFQLPTAFDEIITAYIVDGPKKTSAAWIFNLDASRIFMEVPTVPPTSTPGIIQLETATRTGQFPGGRIVLSAADAQVQGNRAKLESHPGNQRIGFWLDAADTVTWEYKPTRWGMYDLEMTYAAQDGDGTEMQFEIAGKTLTVARPATGSWYRYTTIPVGRFYLEKAQPFTVRVSCKKLTGLAVANLKALTLRPASEGVAIAQAPAGGPITLAASNAITHSVTMRYEPAPNKNCLGYWINANDWAEWEFAVAKPGEYEVEVSHGAGNNQGGSIRVLVNGTYLPFETTNTGDIHKHAELRIGRVKFAAPGPYTLALQPQRKNGGAIMDLGYIRLVPAGSP